MRNSNTPLLTLGCSLSGSLRIQTFQDTTDFMKWNSNNWPCGHGNKRSLMGATPKFGKMPIARIYDRERVIETSSQVSAMITENATWLATSRYMDREQANPWMLSTGPLTTATNTRAESGCRYQKETHLLQHKSNDQ
jgi:hypothetical protein